MQPVLTSSRGFVQGLQEMKINKPPCACAAALWTGLVVGIAYTLFARAMYRQQLAALQREMAREQATVLPAHALPHGPPAETPRWGEDADPMPASPCSSTTSLCVAGALLRGVTAAAVCPWLPRLGAPQ